MAITLSADEFQNLDRKTKRELERSMKKQGLVMPDIKPRRKITCTAEAKYLDEALKVLDKNGMAFDDFLDICLQQLISSS